MKCEHGLELRVYKSNAGWYIGTWDEQGPYCRISGYYASEDDAVIALRNFSFTPRNCIEKCPECEF